MKSFRKKISTKFKNRYRLIIRKDDNLEEKVSIVLTPMNSLLVVSALVVFIGTVIILLLSYTPLSNIMPTTASNFSHEDRLALIEKVDSLESLSRQRDLQEQSLRAILSGDMGDVEDLVDEGPGPEPTSAQADGGLCSSPGQLYLLYSFKRFADGYFQYETQAFCH